MYTTHSNNTSVCAHKIDATTCTLAFWHPNFTFKFEHILYGKCE